ncbi:hypothetical protein ACIBH1_27630 [Nonomuraea sp. NPDC050663]|uniref:hypothetical protein n=1 Tax=Nonomuraea sp. NPDC050663 TaxID=3364370 RepID=UPI0037980569
MLHDLPDAATVDLNEVWQALQMSEPDARGMAAVRALDRRAGGAARRLLFGARSLSDRADRDMLVHVLVVEGRLELTAWSPGCPLNPDRSWWLRSTLSAETDLGFEGAGVNGVHLRAYRTVLAVGGTDGVTVFREDNGRLGEIAAAFYLAWEGRRALADRLGWAPVEPPCEALELEEFLRQARSRVWA